MKKISNLLLALPLLAAVSFAFVGCSKDDPIKEEEVKETLTLSIATKNYEVSGAGETVKIPVMTNQTLSVSVTESWVHAQVIDAKTVSVTIDASEEYEQRTADVTIKGGMLSETVKITQKGSQILTLDKAEHTVPANGGTFTIETKSNFDYEIIMPNVDWIKQSETRSLTTAKVSFDVLVNETTDSREATIVFKDKKGSTEKSLKIKQDAKPVLTVSKDSFEFDEKGGTFSVDVTANVEYEIKISDDWIKQAEGSRGAETKTLSFTVGEMAETDEDRSGIIELSNKDKGLSIKITVKQNSIKIQFVEFEDEEFESYMLEKFDKNKDGKLSIDEAKSVRSISCNNYYITSLKGIEYCVNLQELYCKNNKIKTLDLSGNPKLAKSEFGGNPLQSLSFKGNQVMETLNVNGIGLTSLDIRDCKALRELYCDANNITTLDLSGCEKLQSLDVSRSKLTSIDVSVCTKLKKLKCRESDISSLDLSKNIALVELDCWAAKISSLDLSKNTALVDLYCNANKHSSLDVSKCTSLQILECAGNTISSLDLSKNLALMELACHGNKLSSLDVSLNMALTSLWCNDNQLSTLDVSHNTALKKLSCGNNLLTALDLSKNQDLEWVSCTKNQLTSIDMSSCKKLKEFMCYGNQLVSIDLRNCTELNRLFCYDNQLTSLDLSTNVKITVLYCENNRLTSLDLGNINVYLDYLDCRSNPLETLILPQKRDDTDMLYPYYVKPQYK